MNLKILGRLAGVLALTAGLAGCIDMTAELEVTSDTAGKPSASKATTKTIRRINHLAILAIKPDASV